MTDQSAKTIAITGVNGFVGKHLVRELIGFGHKVIGIGREKTSHAEINELLHTYKSVDLAESWPEIQVDVIIHLAGLAAVGPSFDDPQSYLSINSAMLTHMAEYYLNATKKPRIIVVSSGAVYDSNQHMPLTEESKISFTSPYVVSKFLVENQCEYYRNRGLDCIVVRPFNHLGPGQGPGFLLPDIAMQVKRGNSFTAGNLKTRRDYTDVRDIVRAYRLLATADILQHSVYNAASGASHSGEELAFLIKKVLKKPEAKAKIDSSKIRPSDPIEIYGDASRLKIDTGWKPEIPLIQSVKDFIDTIDD